MSNEEDTALSLVTFPDWKVNLVERYFKSTDGLTALQPQSEESSKSTMSIVDDPGPSNIDVNDNSLNFKSEMCEERPQFASLGAEPLESAKFDSGEPLASTSSYYQKQEINLANCSNQSRRMATVQKRVIFDAEDSSSDDDLVCIKSVMNVKTPPPVVALVPDQLPKTNENYSGIIVDDIIDEVIEEIVAGDPETIALSIIDSILGKLEFKKPLKEQLLVCKGIFSCTDIRYRSKPLVKPEPREIENALSLVVMSNNLREIATFTNEIKRLHRRSFYESYGQGQLDVIRMDFIFQKDRDRKAFQDKVMALPRTKNVFLETKSVPESILCHRVTPSLTEAELLDVCLAKSNKSQSQNVFKAFDVQLLADDENNIKFSFDTLIILNTFLFINLDGLNDAFLGHLRQRANVYTPPLELMTLKCKKKVPMNVQCSSDVNLEDLSEKFKFNVFSKRNKSKEKLISATLDFSKKKDFYKFLTSKECKSFDEIRFKIIK